MSLFTIYEVLDITVDKIKHTDEKDIKMNSLKDTI